MLYSRKERLQRTLPSFQDLFPWLLLLFTYFLAVLFQAKYCDDLLNSDMAAEMILANQLNKEGSLFLTKDWFYPSELRVLYQHIVLRLGLLIFPTKWQFARIFAQAVLLSLHAGSFIFLMSTLGYKKAGVYGAAALMCPFGFWYTFHGFFSGAYLTHMILMSVTIALIIKLTDMAVSKKSIPWILALIVLCFFQGLNGIRMLMNLYAPLCVAVLFMLLLRYLKAPLGASFRQEPLFKILFPAFLSTAACFLGYLLHALYLSKVFVCMTYEGVRWDSFDIGNVLKIWSGFLSVFGYPYDEFATKISSHGWESVSLMSLQGLLGATSIILIAVILLAMVRLIKLWNKLSFSHQFITSLLLSCLVVNGIVYGCLSNNFNNCYWLPLVPVTFAAVIIWIANEAFRLPGLFRRVLGAALLLCIFCVSITSHCQFVRFPPSSASNIEPVVDWLVANGHHQGYATFWNASVLTEYSNGQIEAWSLFPGAFSPSGEVSTHQVYDILQQRSHVDVPPDGACFILMSQTEYNNVPDTVPYHIDENAIIYNENGYVVFGYDSIEDALK